MNSYGPPHMAGQKQDDQLEHTYSSYVRIRDISLKTCQRRWTIGRSGERVSGISELAARHDDNDESYPSRPVWYSTCLLLEISIQFSSYCCSVDPCIVSAVSLRRNESFFVLFYLHYESSYWNFHAIIITSETSSFFFSWHNNRCHLSDLRPYASSLVFMISSSFVKVLPSSTSRIVRSILQSEQLWCLYLSHFMFNIGYLIHLGLNLLS